MDDSIHLRKLKRDDAKFMLEWMHDKELTKLLDKDFSKMTIDNCINFITESQNNKGCLNLAIANVRDEYLGTVSLKNIDRAKKLAEFAIVVRKCAVGKGVSKEAMRAILRIGKEELGLMKIYWYVNKDNLRALRFYDKNMYRRVQICEIDDDLNIVDDGRYFWYVHYYE